MDVQLPGVVQTRQANWQAKNQPPLEARAEFSDWVWEKWNKGELDVPLTNSIERQAVLLKEEKDRIYPSEDGKLEEEFMEALIETQVPATPELLRLAKARYMNPLQFEDIQNGLKLPIEPADKYMQAAIWKLQGRVEANKANPQATGPEIKQALKQYETQVVGKVFNMEV